MRPACSSRGTAVCCHRHTRSGRSLLTPRPVVRVARPPRQLCHARGRLLCHASRFLWSQSCRPTTSRHRCLRSTRACRTLPTCSIPACILRMRLRRSLYASMRRRRSSIPALTPCDPRCGLLGSRDGARDGVRREGLGRRRLRCCRGGHTHCSGPPRPLLHPFLHSQRQAEPDTPRARAC